MFAAENLTTADVVRGTLVATSVKDPPLETTHGLGTCFSVLGGGVFLREKPTRQEAGIPRLVARVEGIDKGVRSERDARPTPFLLARIEVTTAES